MAGTSTTAGKNQMLNNFGVTHAALFNGDPESGGTECSGGGYARQALTFGSAAGGVKSITASPVFNVPASFTVSWIGYYNASSGGTLLWKENVADEAFGSAGTYTINTASFTAAD